MKNNPPTNDFPPDDPMEDYSIAEEGIPAPPPDADDYSLYDDPEMDGYVLDDESAFDPAEPDDLDASVYDPPPPPLTDDDLAGGGAEPPRNDDNWAKSNWWKLALIVVVVILLLFVLARACGSGSCYPWPCKPCRAFRRLFLVSVDCCCLFMLCNGGSHC